MENVASEQSAKHEQSPSAKLNAKQRAYYRSIFEKYDRDGSGTIDAQELATMLREDAEVSEKVVKKLIVYIDRNNDNKINVDEFTDMLLDKKLKALFGHYVTSYVDYLVPKNKRHKFKPVGRRAEEEGVSEPDGTYESGFSIWPPPLCMVLVSIFEIICFTLNEHISDPESDKSPNAFRPVALALIYHPQRRHEAWRFLTYMLVHIGWVHLTMNLLIQLLLGVALELRNRWWRVLTVYMAGVVSGSLMTSIFDPRVFLAGASGGVYAIITAHLANLAINWSDMCFPAIQLFIFLLMIAADVATSVHNRYLTTDETPIGYAAHFGGALAGLLVGIWVLKNVDPTEKEKYLWWAAFVIFLLLLGTAIVLNVFWTEHFSPTNY